jgi:hypothetical protein
MQITIKRNDTQLTFTDTLLVNGVPTDLTGASVSFILKNTATGVTRKRSATITNAEGGAVSYAPVAEDVATEGNFDQEWEVVWVGGKQLSFPTRGYNRVVIAADLA